MRFRQLRDKPRSRPGAAVKTEPCRVGRPDRNTHGGWQGLACGLALVPLLAWPVTAQGANSISGSASTVIEWYDDASGDTVVPAFQYLQLNAMDLGGAGYNFHFYGRLGDDFANEHESWAAGRLYYAYLDKKGFLLDTLDMRLGRQFIASAAGASLMDGLKLDYGFLDKYRFSIYGGGDVSYYEGYNTKDAIFGWEIAGKPISGLNLGFSYLSKWDQGLLSHELFGLNVNYDFANTVYLYNESQWDYLSDRWSYFLIGSKYHRDNWTARVEYLYSMPVFSSTSIYSVFAVSEYQEILAEVTYSLGSGINAFGRYTRELYQEFADANVYEIGLQKIRTDNLSGYLSGVYRDDREGQGLKGFKTHAAYKFNDIIEAGLGAEVDVLQRRVNYFDLDSSPDDTTSSRLWADATLTVTEKINVQGKVERIESDLWNHYNRGRVRLNILF